MTSLPEQLRRREDRLATIRQAKADLEAEADERSRARSAERGEDSDTTEAKAQAAADKAVPRPKAQRNFSPSTNASTPKPSSMTPIR